MDPIHHAFLRQWMEEAQQDASLQFTPQNVQTLLGRHNDEATPSVTTNAVTHQSMIPSYLQDKTYADIQQEIGDVLQQYQWPKEWQHTKLQDYRYVDEIHQLRRGQYVRYMKLPDQRQGQRQSQSQGGGILVDVKFFNKGVHVCCRLFNGRYVQYPFDEYLTFQKLSTDEILILSAQM